MLQDNPIYAYLPALDVQRARRFYEQTLGLVPGEALDGGVSYRFANGTGCFLYPTPNAGTSLASQAFWEVQDIEAEVAQLKARGVQFERYRVPGSERTDPEEAIVTAGGARAAWFKDTEGNILALVQPAEPH